MKPTFWESQAVDPKLRTRRTGGTTTALLRTAMKENLIRRAAVVRSSSRFPWAEASIASTSSELEEAAGSKYTLVGAPEVTQIASSPFASVTLPCMSARARQHGASLVVGLFCGLNISPTGYERLIRSHGGLIEDVISCDFRSPAGGLHAVLRDGTEIHVPRYFWLAYFYPYPKCAACRDYLNRDSDLSIGDRRSEWNAVVVWTPAGARALELAADKGSILASQLAEAEFRERLMSPFHQKEVLGGYDRLWLVRHRRLIRRLPLPILARVGERIFRRTMRNATQHNART
ncbi:Coenzyme F420 hydrogenase/dehydrogenase, beta subunit C-terminal domain [Candidatus Bipolaricaulota bacterium]